MVVAYFVILFISMTSLLITFKYLNYNAFMHIDTKSFELWGVKIYLKIYLSHSIRIIKLIFKNLVSL